MSDGLQKGRATVATDEEQPSLALAVIDTPEGAAEALMGRLVPEVEDPELVAQQIMERILASDSVDEILGGNTALHAQDVLARPFTLHGLRLMRSRFNEGPGVFAVLDAEFGDDGSRGAVTCSARNVMAQAVQLWRLAALPLDVKIMQTETQTANGYHVLYLAKA